MTNSRVVVFDMDDTLYLEREYVRSGFRAVASTAPEPDSAFKTLWAWFEDGVRGDTFNRVLEAFPEWGAQVTVSELVATYRTHQPDIHLLPSAHALIDRLRRASVPVGVLTDGPVASQRAKVHALGLLERADHVLMTDTLGRAHWKPSEKGFEWLEERFGTAASHLVYIGDNPTKDFIAPKRRGWRTIRLRMDGQLRCALESPNEAATAELECTGWAELSTWISAWVGLGE